MHRAQERYRRLVELSPDGSIIVQDHRFVLVNPAALRLMRAADEAQLLAARPLDIFHPDERAGIRARLAALLEGRLTLPVLLAEQRVVCFDDSITDVELAATVLDDDLSNPPWALLCRAQSPEWVRVTVQSWTSHP